MSPFGSSAESSWACAAHGACRGLRGPQLLCRDPPHLLPLLLPVQEKPRKTMRWLRFSLETTQETHCLTSNHKSAFQLWWKTAFLTGKGISRLAVAGGSAARWEGILRCSTIRQPGRRNVINNTKTIQKVGESQALARC